MPDHVCVILDEAYAEYQLHDDPEESVDLWRRSENLVVLRTFSKCYGLAGLRVGYALTSARAPLGFRRGPPALQRERARAGRGRRGDPPPGRRRRSASSARSSSASSSRRASASSGFRRPTRTRTSRGSTWAMPTRARWSRLSATPAWSSGRAHRSADQVTSAFPTARASRTSGLSTGWPEHWKVDGRATADRFGPVRPSRP